MRIGLARRLPARLSGFAFDVASGSRASESQDWIFLMAIKPAEDAETTSPDAKDAHSSTPASEFDLTKKNTGPLWRQYLRAMGPGLVTGASDDDPSGIATYSQAGAQYGLSFLWAALLTLPRAARTGDHPPVVWLARV
jgi:hypothetical protein